MKQPPPLPRADLLDLKSILLRAAMEAERSKRFKDTAKLAEELAQIDMLLAVTR